MSRFEKFKINLLMDSGTRPKTNKTNTKLLFVYEKKLVFSYCLFDLVICKMEMLRCISKVHLFYYSNVFSNFNKSTHGIGL